MPNRPIRITGPDGKAYIWMPDTQNTDLFDKLGEGSGFLSREDAIEADKNADSGSYQQENYTNSRAILPKLMMLGMVAGPAIVSGLGGLAGGAGAGGGGAAGGGALSGEAGYVGADIASVASHGAGPGGSILGGLFKGGSSLSRLGQVGQVLSGAAEGSARGREREALINLQSDELRQRQAENERRDALDRAKLEDDRRVTGQDLESQARRQAAWGVFAQNPDATSPALPPDVQARLGDKYKAPDWSGYKDIGEQAYRAAQLRLLSGSDKQFTPPPTVPTPPLTPQPEPSWLDRLLGHAGTATGIAGALGGYRPPTK